jgi:phosphohistidine phosphatase
MRLYVMRHGPAEDRAASGHDADRQLTAEGREVVERAGRKLRLVRGGAVPRIVTSPLVRARQTGEIVWRLAGDPARPVEEDDALAAEADTPIELARALVARGIDVLVVGHNPNVEALVRELAAPTHPFPGFRTATLVELEVGAGVPVVVGSWPLTTLFDSRRD